MKKVTAAARRALEILDRHDGPIMAGMFAHKMWPDSPSWHRYSNCGPNGAATGMGITRRGGSYLSHLRNKGWVRMWFEGGWQYQITGKGQRALAAKGEPRG